MKNTASADETNRTQCAATMHIEAPAGQVWRHLATAAGMNAFLTDKVICANDSIQAGDKVQIVIGDMVNEAVCLVSEPPLRFVLKDHFRSILADNHYLEYDLTTTFTLEERAPMTKVTVRVEGYRAEDEFMQWLRECGELGWRQSLFNLKNVLELGLDLRYDIFGYPRLGVCNYTANSEQIRANGLDPARCKGNMLMAVFPGSPAAQAGLAKGDLVVELGGYPVPTYREFVKALALSFHRNPSIAVVYYRSGTRFAATAALSSHPLLTGLVQPTEERLARIRKGSANRP